MKKTFRNLICILLIVAVLFPANLVFAASGKDAAKVIEELGIAPTVKFPYFHNNYSRVEFAYILANLDSEYMSGMQATIALKDVAEKNADHAAYAVSKGYLPLDAEGNFRPNDNVTYSEAVVALVKLLGYGDMAESNGGTVSDYISTARWIELTNGAPASLDGHLSKDGLASMVLNAMEIPPVTKIYDGGAIVKGITILKDKNLSVVVKKLLATPTRGIGADVCDEGFINLGGTLIRTDKTIDDSLVGRMVRCYIQNDDGV